MEHRLGAHMSISGGLKNAFGRGEQVGCDTVQIFTKNANQWKAKPITPEDIEGFIGEQKRTGIYPAFAHDSYLINLGSPDPALYEKSIAAFQIEMERAEALKLPFLVMHPGSHVGSGEEEGLKKIAESFNRFHRQCPGFQLKIALETTAGQGTNLGYRFEQLRRIIDMVEEADRLAVCLDTCHVFAAGYNISTPEGYEAVMEEFDRIIGLDRIVAFHLNDAKKGLGSRVDRHEHIGHGALGLEAFRSLVNDPRFNGIPMTLETQKGTDEKGNDWDVVNLEVLRGLIRD